MREPVRILKPGIYPNLTSADYFADPCPSPSLTQSLAKVLIERSPAHAKLEHPRLTHVAVEDEEPEKYDAAKAIGNAAHLLLIKRGKELAVADFDSWRGKDPGKFKEDALAAGKTPILTKHMARAYAMVESTRAQLNACQHSDAFNNGDGEVVLAWQEDGLWFRTMIDWLVDTRTVYDLKTSGMNCAPHVVVDRPGEQGWDIQAAMHERGLDALDPDNAGRRQFFYIAQENAPPYALVPVQISEHDLTMGRKKLAYAIDIWKQCMAANVWPAYPPDTVMSQPRGYSETKWLAREIEHNERPRMLTSLAGG